MSAPTLLVTPPVERVCIRSTITRSGVRDGFLRHTVAELYRCPIARAVGHRLRSAVVVNGVRAHARYRAARARSVQTDVALNAPITVRLRCALEVEVGLARKRLAIQWRLQTAGRCRALGGWHASGTTVPGMPPWQTDGPSVPSRIAATSSCVCGSNAQKPGSGPGLGITRKPPQGSSGGTPPSHENAFQTAGQMTRVSGVQADASVWVQVTEVGAAPVTPESSVDAPLWWQATMARPTKAASHLQGGGRRIPQDSAPGLSLRSGPVRRATRGAGRKS
jgi:hypothetical protein